MYRPHQSPPSFFFSLIFKIFLDRALSVSFLCESLRAEESETATMRAPKTAAIAHKKPNAEMLKKRKAEMKIMKKEKASKKSPGAPKRPATAFFVFMEEFRKTLKENNPDIKSGPAVGKAGGEKWKSMSDSEKAMYIEKALKRKAEYEKALEAYKKLNAKGGDEKAESSEKSTSEVHDGGEEADSS